MLLNSELKKLNSWPHKKKAEERRSNNMAPYKLLIEVSMFDYIKGPPPGVCYMFHLLYTIVIFQVPRQTY
jgi:hypothetical protein